MVILNNSNISNIGNCSKKFEFYEWRHLIVPKSIFYSDTFRRCEYKWIGWIGNLRVGWSREQFCLQTSNSDQQFPRLHSGRVRWYCSALSGLYEMPYIWPNQTKPGDATYFQLRVKEAASVLSASSWCQCSAAQLVWSNNLQQLYLVVDSWKAASLHSLLLLHSSPAVIEQGGERVKHGQDADDLSRVSFGVNEPSEKMADRMQGSLKVQLTCRLWQWLLRSLLKNQFVDISGCFGVKFFQEKFFNMAAWVPCVQTADVLGRWTNVIFDARRAWWPWPHSHTTL